MCEVLEEELNWGGSWVTAKANFPRVAISASVCECLVNNNARELV